MGGPLAVPRKRRHHPAILENALLFSNAMHESLKTGNFEKPAAIACMTALEVAGAGGLMRALDNANSAIRRKRIREGKA